MPVTIPVSGVDVFFYQSVARWFLATGSRTPDVFSLCNGFAHHQNFITSAVKNLHQSAVAVQNFPVLCVPVHQDVRVALNVSGLLLVALAHKSTIFCIWLDRHPLQE